MRNPQNAWRSIGPSRDSTPRPTEWGDWNVCPIWRSGLTQVPFSARVCVGPTDFIDISKETDDDAYIAGNADSTDMPPLSGKIDNSGCHGVTSLRRSSDSSARSGDFDEGDRRVRRMRGICFTHEPGIGREFHHDTQLWGAILGAPAMLPLTQLIAKGQFASKDANGATITGPNLLLGRNTVRKPICSI